MEFILRFSEPEGESTDTIARHQSVIRRSGSVWWGWWRKRSGNREWGEPFQGPRWAEAEQRLKINGSLDIFIVNNQGPDFWRARCTEIRMANGRAIHPPDADLVPEYYRGDKFPVWLRLTNIRKVRRSQYEASCGPTLPYRHATFYTAVRQEGGSIRIGPLPHWDASPLTAQGNGILHISDLHITPGQAIPPGTELPGAASLLDRVQQARERMRVDIGLVVVTGDLINGIKVSGLEEVESRFAPSFRAAGDFLAMLGDQLGLGPESILIVPGNHDLPILSGEDLANAKKEYVHYSAFNQFVDSFYDLSESALGGLQYCERPVVVKFPSAIVGFGLFDSCRLRDQAREHLGYVANHQALPILRWLAEWQSNKPEQRKLSGVIGLVHHHLTPVLPVENPGQADDLTRQRHISIMIDAAQLAETFARYRVSQVWHGHGHVPSIRTLSSDRRGRELSAGPVDLFGVDIVGLGTSGSTRVSPVFPYQSLAIHVVGTDGIENHLMRFNEASDLEGYRSHTRTWSPSPWCS